MTQHAKPDAWMPLYIGDWDGDTRHLDCEQDGAYGRLVRHYWRNGPLPDDDNALARIVGMQLARWRKVRPVMAEFFKVAGGRWTHKRVDAERTRWAEKKERAAERAATAAAARWHPDDPGPRPKGAKRNARRNASSMPEAMLEQCPSPSPKNVEGQLHSPSTLLEGASADLRDDAQSTSRPDVVVDLDRLREEIAESERQRQLRAAGE